MSINRVIINSSPLIVLLKSQQAKLIPQLFTEILVPFGVFEEVTTKDDVASTQLPSIAWIQKVEVNSIAPVVAAWDLGKGESQVLSLALKNSDCAAIVDDRAARRCGQALGITTIAFNKFWGFKSPLLARRSANPQSSRGKYVCLVLNPPKFCGRKPSPQQHFSLQNLITLASRFLVSASLGRLVRERHYELRIILNVSMQMLFLSRREKISK